MKDQTSQVEGAEGAGKLPGKKGRNSENVIQVIYRNFTDSASGIRRKYKHEAQAQASQRDSALAYSLALVLVLIRSLFEIGIFLARQLFGA